MSQQGEPGERSGRAADAIRVGRYLVDGVEGAGAFATVYRGVDERLDDIVAVKVLAENHSLDPDIRERFLAEGRVLRRIDSPCVVRVYDMGETDRQQPFLVLEYADRGTLAGRVAQLRSGGWRPTAGDVLRLARLLAAAVAAVHGADIVHRDLSPGNILIATATTSAAGLGRADRSAVVGEDERLLLADLGLCKDLALNSGHTMAGGTEGFRPPEQRTAPTIVTPAADIWSLSAVVVWLVTGTPPGDGPVRGGVRAAGLPAELGAVLDRGLAHDPAARHPDPTAWLEAVEGAFPPAPAAQEEAPEQGRRHRRGLVRLVGGAAVVLAAAVLGAGLLAWNRSSDDGPEVTHLDGGDVRVERTEAGTTVALAGPEEIEAGTSAVFTAQVGEGVDQWAWVTPERQLVPGARRLEVRASSPGVATVTLVAVVPSGDLASVGHDLRVVPAAGSG